jgi:hypothetical protein
MTTKKKCECGKERIGKALRCPGCAKEIHRKQVAANNKKLNKERREKSTFLEKRKVAAKCPKCCKPHKVWVTIQKHLILTKPIKKACPECEFWFTRSDYGETYSLSGLGRERG